MNKNSKGPFINIVLIAVGITVFVSMIVFANSLNSSNTKASIKSAVSNATTQNSELTYSSEPAYSSGTSSNKSFTKIIDHYCDAEGCKKEGTHKLVGLNGTYEYYCDTHYNEINSFIDKMESDVGSGTASQHKCMVDGCSKEGIHELVGLNGTYEYYCTEHYREMEEVLNMLLGN